jgi:flagellar basal-body rod protein FlgB
MEARETVHGGTRIFQETSPLLYDTTQLALHRAIEGAGARHEAPANNLANANTPGYQRVDVDFHTALSAALGSGGDRRAAVVGASIGAQADRTAVMRADGSSVDIDAESAKLAANALEQQAAVQVARTRTAILQAAMGTGG